ncbi:MAG: PEP-CTERM sorting domain-containing protein [Planctomycetes bacterium]|nr:PEP-CTERM sorting domain-containing protein [Planctomycetota bacterium]
MFVMGRRYFGNPLPYDQIAISQDVMIDAGGESAWVVAAYAGDELIHYVMFSWDGSIVVDDVATGSTWTPQAWQTLTMDLDLETGMATVRLDGGLVSTLAIYGDPSLGIDNLIIFGDNYVEVVPSSMFYDNLNISAIPEPATFALLGFGMIGIVARRKESK